MFRSAKSWCWIGLVALPILGVPFDGAATVRAGITSEEVERAIRDGVRFLKERQLADGSWPEVEGAGTLRHYQPGDLGPADRR